MFKVITLFKNYKHDSIIKNMNVLEVTWFKYNDNENLCEGIWLSDEEANSFINYAVSTTMNFPENNKNKLICSGEIDEEFYLISKEENFGFLHLTKNPTNSKHGIRLKQITLTDSNGNNCHNYNLPFDLVGVITRIIK